MSAGSKLLIGIALIALTFSGFSAVITQENIDYQISKSCEKNKAFQIKGVHYMCLEIQERKK